MRELIMDMDWKRRPYGRTMLLTVRHEHAEIIYQGAKQIEIRRRVPRQRWPFEILIYEPKIGITGAVRCSGLLVGDPLTPFLWETGLSIDEYRRYLLGSKIAVGLCLDNPRPAGRPLDLKQIRKILGDKHHPPQMWRYLSTAKARVLKEHGMIPDIHKKKMTGRM